MVLLLLLSGIKQNNKKQKREQDKARQNTLLSGWPAPLLTPVCLVYAESLLLPVNVVNRFGRRRRESRLLRDFCDDSLEEGWTVAADYHGKFKLKPGWSEYFKHTHTHSFSIKMVY